jgi:hypothetical protein
MKLGQPLLTDTHCREHYNWELGTGIIDLLCMKALLSLGYP